MRRLLVLVIAVAGCNADDVGAAEPAARPCAQLRDHVVDLRLVSAHGAPKDLATHREAMQRALGDDFVSSCEKSMSASQIECGTAAGDLAAVSACSATAARP